MAAAILTSCQVKPIQMKGVAAYPQWKWERAEAGLPREAIILAVAADPLEPAHLWAGYYAPGGLAASRDGGQTWTTSAQGLQDNPIFDLLVVPAQDRDKEKTKIWAAAREGLFWSDDAGDSWQRNFAGLPLAAVYTLAVDASGRLYVGLDGAGIYAETQDKTGWESLTPVEPLASAGVLSLAVSPDGQQLYAGSSGLGLFASQDGGRAWTMTYPGEYVANIALSPNDPDVAVASLRDRLVRTQDGGQSWHTLTTPWGNEWVVSLLWLPDNAPANEGVLGLGTAKGRLYQSPDGGDSWVGGQTGLPPHGVLDLAVTEIRAVDGAPSPDGVPSPDDGTSSGDALSLEGELANKVGFYGNGPMRLLAGSWVGLYSSHDGGQSWQSLASSVGSPNAETLLATERGLFLGTWTGLYHWMSEQRRWVLLPGELPSGVASLAVDPQDARLLYAGTTGDGLYRSHDGGVSWRALPTLRKGVPAIALDPQERDNIYILAAWERVYESHDGGQKWGANWDGLGEVIETTSLAVDPLTSLVYAGTETGLYRRQNNQDWELVAPELADQSILALLAQPYQNLRQAGTTLYIGATRGVYYSLDHGDTVHGGPDDPEWGRGLEDISVTALLTDPSDPHFLWVGTAYNGIYQSVDGGQSWQAIGPDGLNDSVVKSLAWGADGELFAATKDGVWRGQKQ
jgi:photosystem II stability/assembly factor-like uncharacterized protein